jgi:anti-sigma regulatory factor (Ser/Thr protein kinase)
MTSADPPATSTGGRLSPPGVPEVVTLDQPFTADGLYSVRAAVAAHAEDLGASPAIRDHLLIVASELATNAVRHGGGAGRLRLWVDDGRLHLQVTDQGPGFTDPSVGLKPPDQYRLGGRGMWICRHLCQDLHIDTGPTGSTVTAVISLPTQPTAASDGPPRHS